MSTTTAAFTVKDRPMTHSKTFNQTIKPKHLLGTTEMCWETIRQPVADVNCAAGPLLAILLITDVCS